MAGSSEKFWARGSGTIRRWRRKSNPSSRAERRQRQESTTSDWWLKAVAVGLAFLLWTVTKSDSRKVVRNVPIRVVNLDANWVMLDAPQPAAVDIRFAGPVRELIRLTSGRTAVDVRVTEIDDSLTSYPLRLSQVQVLEGGDNIRVDAILHDSVRLVFDRVAERVVPVAVRAAGAPPAGLVLAGPLKPLPPTVRLRGAASRIFAAGLDSIVLPPVDLASLAGTDTLTVAIDTTNLGILSVLPVSVDVVVPLRLAAPDTTTARREIAASSRRR